MESHLDHQRRAGCDRRRSVRVSHALDRHRRARRGCVPVDGAHEAAVTPRGFSLVELLVAMVIVVLLTATIGAAATQARAFFERIPAVIDMQQRGTAALSELSQALRSAVQVTGEAPDGGGY